MLKYRCALNGVESVVPVFPFYFILIIYIFFFVG